MEEIDHNLSLKRAAVKFLNTEAFENHENSKHQNIYPVK
jgi:hypothetical protein